MEDHHLTKPGDETMRFPPGVYPWHAIPFGEVATILGAEPGRGLSPAEARRRLALVGPNRVGEIRETPLWRLLIGQFEASSCSCCSRGRGDGARLGERAEAIAICAALLLNAAIGFATEWRARISLARLRALVVPSRRVRATVTSFTCPRPTWCRVI